MIFYSIPNRASMNSRRNGVTLLEVLLSIGVVFIGLMGAVSLFPVASFQIKEGVKHERAALLGKRAFREFKILGLKNTERWVERDSVPTTSGTQVRVFGDLSRVDDPDIRPADRPLRLGRIDRLRSNFAHCIDPRGVASRTLPGLGNPPNNLTNGIGSVFHPGLTAAHPITSATVDEPFSNQNEFFFAANTFPTPIVLNEVSQEFLGSGGEVQPWLYAIPRISLDSRGSLPLLTVSETADLICGLEDDLEFAMPTVSNTSPTQNFISTANSAPMKRFASGEYSWFAIVVPKLESVVAPAGIMQRAPSQLADVWIPIVYQRTFANWNPSDPASAGESVAVVNFVDQGIGREIELVGNPSSASSAIGKVKVGDWIMLRQPVQLAAGVTTMHDSMYDNIAWYRVIGIDDDIQASPSTPTYPPLPFGAGKQAQLLTLAGPDFNAVITSHTQAIRVEGVIGVYHKTVRLE